MGISLPSVVSAYRMFRGNPSASNAILSDTRVSSPRLLPVVNGMKSIYKCGVACAHFLLAICIYNCEKIDEILYFVYNETNLKTSEEEAMKQSGKKTALAAMGLCAALMLTGCGKSDAAKYEDAQKLVREGA